MSEACNIIEMMVLHTLTSDGNVYLLHWWLYAERELFWLLYVPCISCIYLVLSLLNMHLLVAFASGNLWSTEQCTCRHWPLMDSFNTKGMVGLARKFYSSYVYETFSDTSFCYVLIYGLYLLIYIECWRITFLYLFLS